MYKCMYKCIIIIRYIMIIDIIITLKIYTGTLPILKAGTYEYQLTLSDVAIENEAFKPGSGVRHTICTVDY